MQRAFQFTFFIFLSFPTWAKTTTIRVQVPRIAHVNEVKKDFISIVKQTSRALFPNQLRSGIAPFGGTKITPFLELDLDELMIVTNSYPGTPEEITSEFRQQDKLSGLLSRILNAGSMSTGDVLGINTGAQLLSRLFLELGVREVLMTFWARTGTEIKGIQAFRERKMQPRDEALITTFEFVVKGRKKLLTFVSSNIQGDSSNKPGFPDLIKYFIPAGGFTWAYLSADGLGFFSANANNGLSKSNGQLLKLLQPHGTVLLDYPTHPSYHSPQIVGDLRFMEGRMDLEEMDLKRIKTIAVDRPGIFGYCGQATDEVRIYQKNRGTGVARSGSDAMQIGQSIVWELSN